MHARRTGLLPALLISTTVCVPPAYSFPFWKDYFGGSSGALEGGSTGGYTRTFQWNGPSVQTWSTTARPRFSGVVYSTFQTDGHPSSYPSDAYIPSFGAEFTAVPTSSIDPTAQQTDAQLLATTVLTGTSNTSREMAPSSSAVVIASPEFTAASSETILASPIPGVVITETIEASSRPITVTSKTIVTTSSEIIVAPSNPAAVSSVPAAVSSVPAAVSSVPAAVSSVPAAVSSVPAAVSSVPAAVSSVPAVTSSGAVASSVLAVMSSVQTAVSTVPTGDSSEETAISSSSIAPPSGVAVTSSGVVAATETTNSLSPSSDSIIQTGIVATNIFAAPVATESPPAQFIARADHPVQAVGVTKKDATQTNKFYTNFILDTQDQPVWSQPYALTWAKGTGAAESWGLGISNTDRSSIVYGDPLETGAAPRYFSGQLYIQSIVLSASELGSDTVLTTDSLEQFSIYANLAAGTGQAPLVTFPVVQGMGFVSGLYTSATVLIQSAVYFTTVTQAGTVNDGLTYKWQMALQDGSTWLMYATPTDATGTPPFTLKDSMNLVGPSDFTGLVQIAKSNGSTCAEGVYDAAAGTYAQTAEITGTVSDTVGTYSLDYTRAGSTSQDLLVFALPHHVDSMSSDTQAASTCVQLWTTTKGLAKAYTAESLSFKLMDLPSDIGFDPWNPTTGNVDSVSDTAKTEIVAAAKQELTQNITLATDINTAYGAGKVFGKFASLVYAVSKFGEDSTLADVGLQNLEDAFAVWVNNVQPYPLVYDSYWGGVPSSASYVTGNAGDDYGNTYYNDHHFHYGYFVYAAAVIAHLDPDWLAKGTNKAWVNSLVRDYANPVATDPYFPQSRMFDWYHGHSWATGLFLIADGKSEESTSEDVHAAYGLKMWGYATGDSNMEARGNLMLAVLQGSIQHYFQYDADNDVEPSEFIPNQVSGIMFENKIDHTTYFGQVPEYVEGIHMIPISPVTSYIRPTAFVNQEWAYYFASNDPLYYTPDSDGIISETNFNCTAHEGRNRTFQCTDTAWRGLLMANYAQQDPQLAWQFFAGDASAVGSDGFQFGWLDGGASLTYYLTYVAALGGA